MEKYIALLRGINVGGKHIVKMADLKTVFIDLGYSNVSTYIQSGNILFETQASDTNKLTNNIAVAIENKFGFNVPVITFKADQLQDAIYNNPFYNNSTETDIQKLHLTFLSAIPQKQYLVAIKDFVAEPDQFVIYKNLVFLYCESKYHTTKLSNAFFERKLKVSATTRNWKTTLKLLELSKV